MLQGTGRPTSAEQKAARVPSLTTVQQITKPLPSIPTVTYMSTMISDSDGAGEDRSQVGSSALTNLSR